MLNDLGGILKIEPIEAGFNKNRYITPWLLEEPYYEEGYYIKIDYNQIPDEFKNINEIGVMEIPIKESFDIHSILKDATHLTSIYKRENCWGILNWGGSQYNRHMVVLAEDGVVKAYYMIEAFEKENLSDMGADETEQLPDFKKDEKLNELYEYFYSVSANEKYAITTYETYVFSEGKRINKEPEIQAVDLMRMLPFGIIEIPSYGENIFQTVVSRSGLPDSLKNCNQVSVHGSSDSIEIGIPYIYDSIATRDIDGINIYSKNSDMIFRSGSGYFHEHSVFLLEDFVLKCVIKVDVKGNITYQYVEK